MSCQVFKIQDQKYQKIEHKSNMAVKKAALDKISKFHFLLLNLTVALNPIQVAHCYVLAILSCFIFTNPPITKCAEHFRPKHFLHIKIVLKQHFTANSSMTRKPECVGHIRHTNHLAHNTGIFKCSRKKKAKLDIDWFPWCPTNSKDTDALAYQRLAKIAKETQSNLNTPAWVLKGPLEPMLRGTVACSKARPGNRVVWYVVFIVQSGAAAPARGLICGESSEVISTSSPSLAAERTGAAACSPPSPLAHSTSQPINKHIPSNTSVLKFFNAASDQWGFRCILDLAQIAMEVQILRLVVLKKSQTVF
jgi:hypothetical protein